MKQNIGPTNRFARVVIGSLLADYSLLTAYACPWNWALFVIGAFMVVEGALGFCIWHSLRGTKDMR